MSPKRRKTVSNDTNQLNYANEKREVKEGDNEMKETGKEVKEPLLKGSVEDFKMEFTNMCLEEQSCIIPEIVVMSEIQSNKTEASVQSELPINESLNQTFEHMCPKIRLVSESPEKQDALKQIIIGNFPMEIQLLRAIGRCLPMFSAVSVLKLVDCKLSAEMISMKAEFLAEAGTIKELVLDFNNVPEQNFYLLIQKENNLQTLSLRQCQIDDYGIQLLARELEFKDPPYKQTLEVLNLTGNHITSNGARHIANALRTNRTLISLSLAGNEIGNRGAVFIAEVLEEFPLTYEEVVLRRQRNFKILLDTASIQERQAKLLQPRDIQDSARATISSKKKDKSTGLSTTRMQKKVPTRSSKLSSPNVEMSHQKLKDAEAFSDDTFLEKKQGKSINLDPHPFLQDVHPSGMALWCIGNLTLAHLNLAYNSIGTVGVAALLKAVKYQQSMINADQRGLLHVALQGNPVPGNCFELPELIRLLNTRFAHLSIDSKTSVVTVPSKI